MNSKAPGSFIGACVTCNVVGCKLSKATIYPSACCFSTSNSPSRNRFATEFRYSRALLSASRKTFRVFTHSEAFAMALDAEKKLGEAEGRSARLQLVRDLPYKGVDVFSSSLDYFDKVGMVLVDPMHEVGTFHSLTKNRRFPTVSRMCLAWCWKRMARTTGKRCSSKLPNFVESLEIIVQVQNV